MYPVRNTLLIPTSCMEAVQTVGGTTATKHTATTLSVQVCIREWEFSVAPCCTVNNSPLLLSCGLQCDDVTGSSGLPSNVNLTAAPAALIQSRRSAASGRSSAPEDRRHFWGIASTARVCVCVCVRERAAVQTSALLLDFILRSAAGLSSTRSDMAQRKMDIIGRSVVVALILLCNLSEIFVQASLEVNDTHQQNLNNGYHDMGLTRNKIVTAQFECYQKLMKDNTNNRDEPMCNRTWDGWLCWDDTKSGVVTEQHCPDYFQDFDPSEMVTKICTDTGHWFLHPESNRTWTNYTRCSLHTSEGRMTAMNLFYLALIGHGLSLTSLFISLGIFFHFKSLSCQRITLHKNLFFSFVLNSVVTIIWLTAVANNQELVQRNPTSCKVSQFIHLYLFGCNYFWMLCEGIYLHTLIVVAVFAEKQHLMWYYLLGWGFPLIPASIHAVARSYYYNDNCWISSKTSLLYIIHGPICAALLVNLFFLLNIVRVLITKLKVTHQAESSLYMKAVRATLILVPLLGIQYVLLPYKPEGRVSSEIYDYIMHILMHFQGLLVATIFCFFNGEVQAVLRRHWNQYHIQFGSSLNHSDALRSASYTASSITEVQGCYSIDGHSEHMNGKGCHDGDASILKSDSPFA